MQYRLREGIESEIHDLRTELINLRSAKDSLPGIESYHREGRANFHASRLTESEDDAREILEQRKRFNVEIREVTSRLRELRIEAASYESPWPMGCEDLAGMLEVKTSTVHVWRLRGVLPEPAGKIGRAPWWWRADLLRWAKETDRVNRAVQVSDERRTA